MSEKLFSPSPSDFPRGKQNVSVLLSGKTKHPLSLELATSHLQSAQSSQFDCADVFYVWLMEFHQHWKCVLFLRGLYLFLPVLAINLLAFFSTCHSRELLNRNG